MNNKLLLLTTLILCIAAITYISLEVNGLIGILVNVIFGCVVGYVVFRLQHQ